MTHINTKQSNQYTNNDFSARKQLQTRLSIFSASHPFPIESNFWTLFLVWCFKLLMNKMSIFASTTLREHLSPIPSFPRDGNASITESTLALLRQNLTTNYVEITEDGKSQTVHPIPLLLMKLVWRLGYLTCPMLMMIRLAQWNYKTSFKVDAGIFVYTRRGILAYVVSRFITKSLEGTKSPKRLWARPIKKLILTPQEKKSPN